MAKDLTAHSPARLHWVDVLRGLVIVIMALDHARDFWHLGGFPPEDLTRTTPELFFTRWITHFCAPVFLFLSGVSAWLHRDRNAMTNGALARFLLTRGLWLVFIELTVINFSWQFGFSSLFVQVIWAIGVSMIALAALIYLPVALIALISIVMIAGHNALDGISGQGYSALDILWYVLHEPKWVPFPQGWGPSGIFIAYPLIPWIGVMGLGYACGSLFAKGVQGKTLWYVLAGLGLTVGFAALRYSNLYGDAALWSAQERGAIFTVLSFLNTTKYPPSLLYLLMTLGPAIALIPFLDKMRGPFGTVFQTFGRVPFFFYVLHVPLLHGLAKLWFGLTEGVWSINFFNPSASGIEPSLLRAYVATVIVVGLLYPACLWFAEVKRRHRDWKWLSYL